jgi:transposase
VRWALEALVVQHLTVARVAQALDVAWDTANDAVLAEGRRVLIDVPGRFDGVTTIGVDEHCWRHTRKGDRYVTVIIDLTPIRLGTGPSRLLDMVEGRSSAVFSTWLADRAQAWRDAVEVVAMDGFTGFKTATTKQLPDAVAVMDPFHTVRLAGDALDACRRRVQQDLHGHQLTARPHHRPVVPGETHSAHRARPAHRPAGHTAGGAVRRRGACRGRGHLGHLPADHRRLPPPRKNLTVASSRARSSTT